LSIVFSLSYAAFLFNNFGFNAIFFVLRVAFVFYFKRWVKKGLCKSSFFLRSWLSSKLSAGLIKNKKRGWFGGALIFLVLQFLKCVEKRYKNLLFELSKGSKGPIIRVTFVCF